MMGVDVMKEQLIERIQQGDEQLIRVLFAVSEALEKEESQADMADDEIIGYRVDTGQALRAEEADEAFEAIVEDVKKGQGTEIDDLIKKRSARW